MLFVEGKGMGGQEDRDEKIERMEAELEKDAKSLFTDAPDPGPIPAVLRGGPAKKPEPEDVISDTAGMAKAWAVALDFVFTIIAGAAVGWLADRWLKSAPTGLLVGLGLGFVLAFWRIVQSTRRQEAAERAKRGGS